MRGQKSLCIFVIITYLLGIVLSVFIAVTGGHESRFILSGYLSMFIPAIAVLIMDTIFKDPLNINWNQLPVKWILPALFLMPAVIHAVCLPLTSFLNNGNLPWQLWLNPNEHSLYHSPANKGWGILNHSELIARIIVNAITGVIIVSVLALFEEVGWRAWMLPRLIKIFNVKKGVLIGAFVWALWHIPFILSGISYIDNIPMSATLLIPFGTFGAGIIISWLWLKTKNIWIVSLAHGALNNWGQYAFKYMQDLNSSHSMLLLTGVEASLLITGFIIFSTMKNCPRNRKP
jgi:CAAX protease family protein